MRWASGWWAEWELDAAAYEAGTPLQLTQSHEGLLMAEGVEKVPKIKNFEIMSKEYCCKRGSHEQ